MSFQIRPVEKADKEWVCSLLKEWWAGPVIVTRGKAHRVDEYPGYIAVQNGERAGLVTYHIDKDECEITSMNSLCEGKGIGTALVDAVKNAAAKANCERLWLITTNDNTKAQHFWKRRKFQQSVIYLNSIAQSRLLKPEIPLTNDVGVPIRDEIEFQIMLKR